MLDTYAHSYSARQTLYTQLEQQSAELVLKALKEFGKVHPEILQHYANNCKNDMSQVLRYMALSVLVDDETLFKEQMLIWLDTVIVAHKKQAYCLIAYQALKAEIARTPTIAHKNLLNPYFALIFQALSAHV